MSRRWPKLWLRAPGSGSTSAIRYCSSVISVGAHFEWCYLGDRVAQHFIIEPSDRAPVDREAPRVAELPRFAFDLGALDHLERLRLLVVERLDVHLGAAVGGVIIALADQPEA